MNTGVKKVALITGAAQGLGLAMVQKLIADGWRVEGWDLKAVSSFQHPDFELKAVDVSSEASVKAAAQALVEKKGIPHALINNAGITRDALLHKMGVSEFEATWKVNVLGSFLPTQIVGSYMREANSAAQKASLVPEARRIIMISSIAGLFGNVGQANYAATKAAVVGMMKSVAKEWGRFNISAVAIAPGFMRTEIIKTVPEKIVAEFVERTPLKRIGEPEELGSFVAFLCKPEASFIHGEVIAFSGGLSL